MPRITSQASCKSLVFQTKLTLGTLMLKRFLLFDISNTLEYSENYCSSKAQILKELKSEVSYYGHRRFSELPGIEAKFVHGLHDAILASFHEVWERDFAAIVDNELSIDLEIAVTGWQVFDIFAWSLADGYFCSDDTLDAIMILNRVIEVIHEYGKDDYTDIEVDLEEVDYAQAKAIFEPIFPWLTVQESATK